MIIYLSILFIILAGHYLFFLIKIFRGLGNIDLPFNDGLENPFISVIIPFRNESQNILNTIESINGLHYPREKYEVIYVDDNSDDNSFLIAESARKEADIRILKLPGEIPGEGNKKHALQYGIENSHGEIIVTTDADCLFNSNWLNSILSCFDKETALVSGPVEFIETPGLFSKIQSTEFGGLILAGAGLIGAGQPVICNGANIAYRKTVFDEVGGLEDNLHLASGDDGFLLQKIARNTDYKIRFCPLREAVVKTLPNHSMSGFISQRRRWASKSLFYKDSALIAELLLIFLFYAGLAAQTILIFSGYYYLTLTLFVSLLIKIVIEFLIIRKGEKLFLPKSRFGIFLLTEIFHVPYIIIASVAGIVGGFKWKGRNIRR